jgi:formylglycine-generating enzyme required for sulfatase activity
MRPDSGKKMLGKDTSRHPVETVNWDEAVAFCHRLSAMPAERAAERVYRLPTEAEWEYACRAGTTTRWYSGNDEAGLVDVAWFKKNAGGTTQPVGEKKPNAWGLYDMHGNVYQWCSDLFSADYYKQSPPSDPVGPTTGSGGRGRVFRGGCAGLNPSDCRSAFRSYDLPGVRSRWNGFRVVMER